jgi:hypothetical protein
LVTSRHILHAVTLALLCAGVAPALATKLDDITCDALKLERTRIETDAIKSDMEKGPEWAKGNLSSDRLKEIEQLIGLQETIAFRCPLPKPLPVDPNDPNAAAAAQVKPGDANTIKPAGTADQAENYFQMAPGLSPSLTGSPPKPPKKAPQVNPAAPQSAPAPAPAAAVKSAKPAVVPAPAKAAVASPPVSKKPKVTDAYVPPPRTGIQPDDVESPELAPAPAQ